MADQVEVAEKLGICIDYVLVTERITP